MPMPTLNQEEFDALVNELLKKVNNLRFDDYYGGIALVNEFEAFVKLHDGRPGVNYLTISEVHGILADFENTRKLKRPTDKMRHFNSAITGLKSDIASMITDRHWDKDLPV